MIKNVNGISVEMAEEEITAIQAEAKRFELMERSRPLSTEEISRMLIAAQINTMSVDDNTALRMREFYPEWASGVDYPAGYKVRDGGRLWRCRQAHSSIVGWEPVNAPALWEQINETHTGTGDDPIPYEGNMVLKNGLYYMQDWVVYRCIRDTGNPVYHRLEELVGIYVERI